MNAWTRSWASIARRIVVAAGSLIALTMTLDASAARRFEMALFGSSDPNYTDLDWATPSSPVPAGPRRFILNIDGVELPNLIIYLANLTQDQRDRLAATVIDEPYWVATGRTNWTNPCTPGDPRITQIWATQTQLANTASIVRTHAPHARFWVNFSEPEIQWMQASCIFNESYIDVISLDKYFVSFSGVQGYYSWLIAHRSKQSQQLALVPGTFHRNSPNYQNPGLAAAFLQGYFDYANNLNAPGWEAPMVWLIAGWPADSVVAVDGETWHGIFNPTSWPIAQMWQARFFEQRYNTLAGYIDSIDTASMLITGWAVDRTAGVPPYIDIYVDGQYWGGARPSDYRADIDSIYGIKKSQWSFTIPANRNDRRCHSIQAYAVAYTAETWNHNQLRTAAGDRFCFPGVVGPPPIEP